MLDVRMPQVLQGAFSTASTILESPKNKRSIASGLGAIAIACLFGFHYMNDKSKNCLRPWISVKVRDHNDKISVQNLEKDAIRYQRYETLFLGSALISTIAATAIATTAMLTRR